MKEELPLRLMKVLEANGRIEEAMTLFHDVQIQVLEAFPRRGSSLTTVRLHWPSLTLMQGLVPSISLYTETIRLLLTIKKPQQALALFEDMKRVYKRKNIPSEAFASLVRSCVEAARIPNVRLPSPWPLSVQQVLTCTVHPDRGQSKNAGSLEGCIRHAEEDT